MLPDRYAVHGYVMSLLHFHSTRHRSSGSSRGGRCSERSTTVTIPHQTHHRQIQEHGPRDERETRLDTRIHLNHTRLHCKYLFPEVATYKERLGEQVTARTDGALTLTVRSALQHPTGRASSSSLEMITIIEAIQPLFLVIYSF